MYTNQPTVVSCVLVVVGCKVLVEMSDNSIVELSVPWGAPNESTLNLYGYSGWRNLTEPQLRERAREHNSNARHDANYALHLHKERVYGHGYALRGY